MKTLNIALKKSRNDLTIILIAASLFTTLSCRATDLAYVLGSNGLTSLSYKGFEMMSASWAGKITLPGPPVLRRPDGTTYSASGITGYSKSGNIITVTCNWCVVTVAYSQTGEQLLVDLTMHNTSATDVIQVSRIHLGRLLYPQDVYVSWVGQVPYLFSGGIVLSNANRTVPAAMMDFGSGVVVGAANRYADSTFGGFWSAEGNRINSWGVALDEIPPSGSKTLQASLRFGPAGSNLRQLAGDIWTGYVAANPSTLNWPDRNPIGKLFLASNGITDNGGLNPNRWNLAYGLIDTTTTAGKENFRTLLLAQADVHVSSLLAMQAQGGIVWDIEGQTTGQTYYADPRILPQIAPEMEYQGSHAEKTVEAYFKKFADAGLKIGICIRPQQVSLINGYWTQTELTTQAAMIAELQAKITYAKNRWGVSLFYVDSDYNVYGRSYQQLQAANPTVLLIPEWDTPLHYSCTAPLQSWTHFGNSNAKTDESIRDLYPSAFICTFADGCATANATSLELLTHGVAGGDVLMVNSFYGVTNDILKVDDIYNEVYGILPTDLSGCALWLDASSLNALSDGSRVHFWEDSSPANHDMCSIYQRYGNSANRSPILKKNVLNGQSAVRFDPTAADGDYRDVLFQINGTYGGHFFTALNQSVPTTVFYVYNRMETGFDNYDWSFSLNQLQHKHDKVVSQSSPYPTWFTFSTAINQWHIEQVNIDPVLANCKIWRDGALLSGSSTTGLNSIDLGSLVLGGKAGWSNNAKVDFAEVIIYNRVLTPAEASELGLALAQKYGIPTSY